MQAVYHTPAMHPPAPAPSRCAQRLLFCLFCALYGALGCGHSAPSAHGAQAAPGTGAATQGAALRSPLQLGQVVAVGPSGLALPVLLRPVSPEGRRFTVAAARALRLIYEEDVDDASQLVALLHRLDDPNTPVDPLVAEAYRPVLEAGLGRAGRLTACAPGLRALKDAYRNVYIEDGTQALRRLDTAACTLAQQLLQPVLQAEPTWIVTIEPLGPKPIAELLAPCRS